MESRNEALLRAMIDGTGKGDLEPAQSRIEALLYELMDKIDGGGGGGGGGGGLVAPVFTYDENAGTYSCDMTFAQVYDAVTSGQCIYAKEDRWGDGTYSLYYFGGCSEDYISFGPLVALGWGGTSYRWVECYYLGYSSDGTIEQRKEDVDTRPGT